MAEEAKLLRQLSARLPARQDGKLNPPPVYNDTRSFDDALQEMIAKPLDTPEYRHVKLLLAYKAKNKPADLADTLKALHEALNYTLFSLVAAHAGAAIKHHFVERDDVLARMLPFAKLRRNP